MTAKAKVRPGFFAFLRAVFARWIADFNQALLLGEDDAAVARAEDAASSVFRERRYYTNGSP
jgi:hypothetical protein